MKQITKFLLPVLILILVETNSFAEVKSENSSSKCAALFSLKTELYPDKLELRKEIVRESDEFQESRKNKRNIAPYGMFGLKKSNWDSKKTIQERIKNYYSRISTNPFAFEMRNRGLAEYREILGPVFQSAIRKASSSLHWVDLGAGEFAAQRELSNQKRKTGKKTAIAAAAPESYEANNFLKATDKEAFAFYGEFFNKETAAKIVEERGQADLVSDVLGVHTYVIDPQDYFESVGALLKVGGILTTHIPKGLYVVDSKGNRFPYSAWILDIKGFEVISLDEGYISLVKVSEEVVAPPLKLVKFIQGDINPIPLRVYLYPEAR